MIIFLSEFMSIWICYDPKHLQSYNLNHHKTITIFKILRNSQTSHYEMQITTDNKKITIFVKIHISINVLRSHFTWYAMSLCHASTSTPIHAIASGGPSPSSPRLFTAAEKLLADSCSIHTRQFTRLNLTSSVKDLLDSECSSTTLWLESETNKDGDVDDSAPHWKGDVDACLKRNCLDRSWFLRICLPCSFTLILLRWGALVLMFNLSTDNAVFLHSKYNF